MILSAIFLIQEFSGRLTCSSDCIFFGALMHDKLERMRANVAYAYYLVHEPGLCDAVFIKIGYSLRTFAEFKNIIESAIPFEVDDLPKQAFSLYEVITV